MNKLTVSKKIKMVVSDFDGIFTDNCIYVNEDKSFSRKINFKDVMGISLLKKNGIETAIISGEQNSAIELLAEKFSLTEVFQSIRVKIDVLKSLLERYNLSADEVLYIGDDVNDMECLNFVTTRITVPNANNKIKQISGIQVTSCVGGDGAFREVVDCLLEASN